MYKQYPFLSDELSLIRAVFSHSGKPFVNTHLKTLAIFSVVHERLQLGYTLLPRLMNLYQWLNTEFSNNITYEDARDFSYDDLVNECTRSKIMVTEKNKQFFEILKGQPLINCLWKHFQHKSRSSACMCPVCVCVCYH